MAASTLHTTPSRDNKPISQQSGKSRNQNQNVGQPKPINRKLAETETLNPVASKPQDQPGDSWLREFGSTSVRVEGLKRVGFRVLILGFKVSSLGFRV